MKQNDSALLPLLWLDRARLMAYVLRFERVLITSEAKGWPLSKTERKSLRKTIDLIVTIMVANRMTLEMDKEIRKVWEKVNDGTDN